MPSRSGPKIRFAIILLVIASACLIAVLLACPPSTGRKEKPSAPSENPLTPPSRTGGEATAPPPASRPERPEGRGILVVVIDDAGYNLEELEPFLALSGPLTVAVLPNLPHSGEAARRVREAGKDLILHCPMEAQGGEDPGPGALRTDQSPQEIERLLAAAFASVPGAAGMNNHMGSKATADEALMTAVMRFLKKEGKLFLDSRTSSATVGEAMAMRAGVPYIRRDLFIDVGKSGDEIAQAFSAGIEIARTRGFAVIIGHVQNRGALDILRKGEQGLGDEGVRLARLSEILENRKREPAQ